MTVAQHNLPGLISNAAASSMLLDCKGPGLGLLIDRSRMKMASTIDTNPGRAGAVFVE
jgi:hypothetical protein